MHAWEQIQQTIEFIEDHLGEEIKIENLANMASLSPFYFQRLFSRLVKKPAAEYIKLRRMAKATEDLRQKEKRILDIALELGFTSHEHFTRVFKETFGMTPNEYRNHPQTMNRMTKPQLLLNYTLVDEGVPLITDEIVIEINRRHLLETEYFIGLKKKISIPFITGLGTESGVNPLGNLWRAFHEQKAEIMEVIADEEELGASYPCSEEGYFNYFVGARAKVSQVPKDFQGWELISGEYIICTFEAENFESLVRDALYKAFQYLNNVWLPNHKLRTAAFSAERYASHSSDTTKMEIWLKVI